METQYFFSARFDTGAREESYTKGFDYLFSHPSPASLVVAAANERERQGQVSATSKHKDAKNLDLFGRKAYSIGSLQLHIANQQALLEWYNFSLGDSLNKFENSILQESNQEFAALLEEGRSVARTSL